MSRVHKHHYLLAAFVSSFLFFVGAGYFVHFDSAQAATIIWDGGGTDGTCGGGVGDGNNWSCAANWVGDVIPGSADIATFDGTSSKDATVDAGFAGSILGSSIAAGYGGTITLSRSLAIGTAGYIQAAGTFDATSQTITVTGGPWTHTAGGTFTAGTGTVSFAGATATTDVAVTETFNNLIVAKTTANNLIITSGDTLVVLGTLTLTDGLVNTGTIDTRGNTTQASTFDGGTAIINFGDNSVVQTYTVNGGIGPTLRFDSASDASDSLTFSAAGTLSGLTTTSSFTGAIPIVNSGNRVLTFSVWTQAGGTYDASAQSSWVFRNFTLSSPATFVAPTLITVLATTGTGTANWNVNSSQTVNNLTKAGNAFFYISAPDTIVVNGTLTLTDGGIGSGTIDARGNIVQTAAFDGSDADEGYIDFGNDSVAQTYTVTGNGSATPHLRFNSTADASDSLVFTGSGLTYITSIVVTSGFSGVIPISNAGNNTILALKWVQAAGTYDASAQSLWRIITFERTGGAFIAPATVQTNGSNIVWDINGNQTFDNFTLLHSNALTLGTTDSTLTIAGTFTLTNGTLETTGTNGAFIPQGDVVIASTFDGGAAKMSFEGSSTQSFDLTSATGLYNGDIAINKSGGQVNLASALVMDAASQDLTIVEGTFDLAGQNLTVNGTSGTLSVEDGGVLERFGAETITLIAGQPTLGDDSTVRYTGDGDAGADTYTVTTLTNTYGNLDITSTDAATDTFQLGVPIEMNGDFTLTSGTFDVTGGNHTMLVHGDWANTGTFIPQGGMVTLNGPDHTITGTTTFFDFTDTTAPATLTFPAGLTQTFTGTLTLTGVDAANRLSLRSSTPGVQAKIDPQGPRVLQFLDVQDNDNDNVLVANCADGCVNSGNNENWSFGSTGGGGGGGGSIAPTDPSIETASCTVSQTIQVELSGRNIKDYLLSEDSNFNGVNWKAFTPQSGTTMTVPFTLSAGEEAKTLYAKFRSQTGNQSGVYIAHIVLDETNSCVLAPEPEPEPEEPSPISDYSRTVDVSTIYARDAAGVLHPVPNLPTFLSYSNGCNDFSYFETEDVEDATIGSPLLLKSGVTLVKFRDDPRVYAVEEDPINPDGRLLRWISTEDVAEANFGARWNLYVLDLPAMDPDYRIGDPIVSTEFNGDVRGLRSRAALNATISYELSIVLPDGSWRSGSKYARVTTSDNGIQTFSFEDSSDFDYNDVVLKLDPTNCLSVDITALPLEAKLHHQIWLTIYWEGVQQADVLVFNDSHDAVTHVATVNASNELLFSDLFIQAKKQALRKRTGE